MDEGRRQRWLWRASLEGDVAAGSALLRESRRRGDPVGRVLATLAVAPRDRHGWEAVAVAIDALVAARDAGGRRLDAVAHSGLLASWAGVTRPARDAWLGRVVEDRASAPWLSWCTSLTVTARVFDASLSCTLRAASDPGIVRALRLVDCTLPEDGRGLRAALWPWLGRVGPGCLERLELRGMAIGSTMRESRSPLLDAMLDLDGLRGLRELALVSCQLGAGDAVTLSRCERLERLRRLDLTDNDLGDPGAEVIAAAPCLQALERLELSRNHIGDRGTAALASSQRLPALRRLGLDANLIGYDGACALASSPAVAALEHLDLYGNRLDVYGCNALSASIHLRPELRRQAHEWQYRATDEELLAIIEEDFEGYWDLPFEDHARLDRAERAVCWEFELSRHRDDAHWQEMQAYAELRRHAERQHADDCDDLACFDAHDMQESGVMARSSVRLLDWYIPDWLDDPDEVQDELDRAVLRQRLERSQPGRGWRWWDPDDTDWLWLQAAELCHDREADDLEDSDVNTWPLELALMWQARRRL